MKRVLVVDDEEEFRSFCRRALEKEGYLVGEAASVEEALSARFEHDIIVLDYALGDGSAEDVMKVISSDQDAVPVILVSGVNPPADVIRRLESDGIVEYIEKPSRLSKIVKAVARAAKISDAISVSEKACQFLGEFVGIQVGG